MTKGTYKKGLKSSPKKGIVKVKRKNGDLRKLA